jgi:hypothetical protein
MSEISLLNSFKTSGQTPLDSKVYVKTLYEITNLGVNDFRAYSYYDGMIIHCVENHKQYIWREANDSFGEPLRDSFFTYPEGTITDGTDYSNRSFNFFLYSDSYAPSGFEQVTENGNTGWRFIQEAPADNVKRYFIGDGAIDAMLFNDEDSASNPNLPDLPLFPHGTRSEGGINFGTFNKDNASFYSTIIGAGNQTNAYANAVLLGTYNNAGYGYGDVLIGSYNTTVPTDVNSFLFAMGHNVNINSGNFAAGIGLALSVKARGQVAVGVANVPWEGGVSASNRPAFTVGIGTTNTPSGRWTATSLKDGLNVLYSGEVIADSITNAKIDAESTGKVLVSKEWVLENFQLKNID